MLQANNASLISIVYNNLFILLKNIFFFYYILRCIIHRSITYYKLHPSSIPQSILSSPPHPMPNFNFYIPLLCSMYISHTVRCSLALCTYNMIDFQKNEFMGKIGLKQAIHKQFCLGIPTQSFLQTYTSILYWRVCLCMLYSTHIDLPLLITLLNFTTKSQWNVTLYNIYTSLISLTRGMVLMTRFMSYKILPEVSIELSSLQ